MMIKLHCPNCKKKQPIKDMDWSGGIIEAIIAFTCKVCGERVERKASAIEFIKYFHD